MQEELLHLNRALVLLADGQLLALLAGNYLHFSYYLASHEAWTREDMDCWCQRASWIANLAPTLEEVLGWRQVGWDENRALEVEAQIQSNKWEGFSILDRFWQHQLRANLLKFVALRSGADPTNTWATVDVSCPKYVWRLGHHWVPLVDSTRVQVIGWAKPCWR